MTRLNSDLLPPIFDQVVAHFGGNAVGSDTRADIVDTLLNVIANAVADNVREMRLTQATDKGDGYPDLQTSDRLSGESLSRARIASQMQETVALSPPVLETALLLIESQIDLRIKRNGKHGFKFRGIRFYLDETQESDISSWCQGILPSIMQGASNDRSTIWQRLERHRPEGIRILIEGLQLAATLRDAVPYKISVDKYLIDPLVLERNVDSASRVRMLHISDLHLVEDITEPGRKLTSPFGAATHQFNSARFLAGTVHGLQPKYDLLLVTGDLTTDGARGSFETVRDYIQSGSLSGENPKRIATFGLSAGPERRLLIPGNHDRFAGKFVPGQRLSGLFEEVLKTPWPYPYVVGYRPPGREPNSLTLLFFVFDSNLPVCPEANDFKGRVLAIARGSITSEEIRKALDEAKEVAKNKAVKDLYGKRLDLDPQKTIRIAVLHHHPFVSVEAEKELEDRSSFWSHPIKSIGQVFRQVDASLMKMENAEEFLQGCFRCGVQLMLFGHTHIPYYRTVRINRTKPGGEHQTPFGKMSEVIHGFCCASALEHTASENGFYLLDFLDEKRMSVDFYSSKRDHKSDPRPFIRLPEKCREIDLFTSDANANNTTWLNEWPEQP